LNFDLTSDQNFSASKLNLGFMLQRLDYWR